MKKRILDYINYNIQNFSEDNCTELYTEETVATIMIVYQKTLQQLEFDVFDTIQFHIFFDKDSITTDNIVNVKLVSSKAMNDEGAVKSLVEKMVEIYGADKNGKSAWDTDDIIALKNKQLKRVWTIGEGESFVSISNKGDKGVSLNIIFAHKLIDFTKRNK